jgi:hypothetical protein
MFALFSGAEPAPWRPDVDPGATTPDPTRPATAETALVEIHSVHVRPGTLRTLCHNLILEPELDRLPTVVAEIAGTVLPPEICELSRRNDSIIAISQKLDRVLAITVFQHHAEAGILVPIPGEDAVPKAEGDGAGS